MQAEHEVKAERIEVLALEMSERWLTLLNATRTDWPSTLISIMGAHYCFASRAVHALM